MIKIIILGAGNGGVMAALGLEKKFRNRKDISITIVDKRVYHEFHPNLYEVATAEEELVSQEQLKKSITLPLAEIFSGKNIIIVQDTVVGIDRSAKTVSLQLKKISYDYLIIAMGSTTDYFNIPGAKENSLPLKSLADALRIRNQLEFAIQAHRLDISKRNLRIVVAGGGYTGVELAGELSHEIELLAWKNQYPLEKIEIALIEAMSQLIPGFSSRLSQDALWHLRNNGVRVMLSSPIAKVDEHFLELANGERVAFDVLVWTTGVRSVELPCTEPLVLDRKGRIITNEFLQSQDDSAIFAVGDCAAVTNVDGRPAPPTAQDAITQGSYIATALPLLMQNKKPVAYAGQKHGAIIALGGKYFIMDYGGVYLRGWFAYAARQLANVHYYASIVGWWKAVQYIALQIKIYSRND